MVSQSCRPPPPTANYPMPSTIGTGRLVIMICPLICHCFLFLCLHKYSPILAWLLIIIGCYVFLLLICHIGTQRDMWLSFLLCNDHNNNNYQLLQQMLFPSNWLILFVDWCVFLSFLVTAATANETMLLRHWPHLDPNQTASGGNWRIISGNTPGGGANFVLNNGSSSRQSNIVASVADGGKRMQSMEGAGAFATKPQK